MNYGVGDWVVCVEDAGTGKRERLIKVGSKLAVRELVAPGTMLSFTLESREWGVRFEAHRNFILNSGAEVPYPARCFRKLLRSDLPAKSTATRQPKAVTQ